jgi:multiple sugar transport system permease protein
MTTLGTTTSATRGAALLDRAPARGRPVGRREPRAWPLYLVLTLGLVLLVAPFVWMVIGSFKPPHDFLVAPPPIMPTDPTLTNYNNLFTALDFPRFFLNSTIVATSITVGNLVFCSMLGYALAKIQFRGRGMLFKLVLATLMVPGSVTVIPLFVLISLLGLPNTYPGLVLPFLAGPFGVFLMRQFMLGIPDELLDAGRVDGAGEWRIFWGIVMPLAKAALATLGILTFLASWNAFLWPLVAATDASMYTLPVALATFSRGQHQADYGLLMAGSVVIVLPVLVVFILLQRSFTQGIATTGLKG